MDQNQDIDPDLDQNLPHLTKKYPSCSHCGWQASFQPAVPWVDHVLYVAGAESPRHAHAHPHHHPGHQDHDEVGSEDKQEIGTEE